MRLAVTTGALCAVLTLAAAVPGVAGDAKPIAVKLVAQSGSGETGTAVFQDTDDGVLVTVHVNQTSVAQPAHIHPGSCASPDPKPAFMLHTVMDGTSTTTIPKKTVAELAGKYSINVHKSTSDFAYVSCGEIAKSN